MIIFTKVSLFFILKNNITYIDPKLCEGLPGLLILDAVDNSSTSSSSLNFFYINTKGTEDTNDDGAPVALNGNTTKLDCSAGFGSCSIVTASFAFFAVHAGLKLKKIT